MCREVDTFGILIKQTRQIIECRYCSNEVVVGSMDLPMGENTEARPGKFKLRKFSKDERVPPMAVVGREAKTWTIQMRLMIRTPEAPTTTDCWIIAASQSIILGFT
jgi:hypothetical protein